jgi:pyruvate formate lyase activating enzyme
MTGKIFNIQRFTIHDGPGVRTEVFFKGCPLNCLWCSNPEGISPASQLGIYPAKCIGSDKCRMCLDACPQKKTPLVFNGNIIESALREKCGAGCMACAAACPASAIIQWGLDKTVDGLLKVILSDRSLYKKSGGGVTLSGGEVMLQWEFARDLLRTCKKNYIHTCVESALFCSQEHMEAVYEFADMVITDIKHIDSQTHKRYTGVGNEVILENIKRTVELNKPLIVRIPVVPGYNDDFENILETGRFIRDVLENKVLQVQLLPYRKLGVEKYDSLNLGYPMGNDYVPTERSVWEANLLYLTDMLKKAGVPAVAGSNEKY